MTNTAPTPYLYKRRAHKAFDRLWQYSSEMSRTAAYYWLSRAMDLPLDQCHIRFFTKEQCKQVVELIEARKKRLLNTSYPC